MASLTQNTDSKPSKGLKKIWSKLNPNQKKQAVVAVAVALFILLVAAIYIKKTISPGEQPQTGAARQEKPKELFVDPKLLDKQYTNTIKDEMGKRDTEITALKGMLEDIKKQVETQGQERRKESEGTGTAPKAAPPLPLQPGTAQKQSGAASVPDKNLSRPQPPVPGSGNGNPAQLYPPSPTNTGGEAPVNTFPAASAGGIESKKGLQAQNQKAQGAGQTAKADYAAGGIEVVSVSSAPQQKAKAAENGLKFYLPPSFMPATLLTGVRAGTMQGGQSKEKPLLIRIKDLAVLPNEIKSNLKGCFVIASVQGDLSDERAHARLTNLSCISKTGESVVEAKVKGYVVDADGQIGLAGTVVTRMGALLGRSVLAGFFGGMGEAVENSTKITSVSALGSTQSINPDKILMAGAGKGIGTGFEKLQDFYLDMAKQTFPVVEVGSVKDITIVIEEGVVLAVKDYCLGGLECDSH